MAKEEEQYLKENGSLLFEAMNQPLPTLRIDFYLREGNLHLGKERLEIFETPGHSPGSLCIYWPEQKALFTGDVIFYGGIGRTDFMEGNPQELMRSIERMSRLETEVLLLMLLILHRIYQKEQLPIIRRKSESKHLV